MAHDPPKLEGGFGVRVEPSDERHAHLTVEHDGIRSRLRAAVLSVPYPSGLARLLAAEPDTEVVLVERIPRGLAAAAQERGVGYLDVHGRGFLKGHGVVYYATAAPDLSGIVAPSRTSPFAPKASRMVRALLSDPRRKWRISHLATSVGLNPGNAHRTLSSLQELGFVEQDRERYVVPDPGSLLEAWADASRPARQHVSLPSEGELIKDVANVVRRLDGCASISGELAAELLTAHLPAQSAIVHCLDADAWERLQSASEPSPLLWNPGPVAVPDRIVVNLADEGTGQFGRSVDGLDLVSPQQLYVDLARAPGRGRQAADEVRAQRLGY
jgi:hypothetical protein